MKALRSTALAAAGMLCCASCSWVGIGDDPDMPVTVVRGIELAPAELQAAEGPVARYLADSAVLVFVSAPLYSSSCPPTAEADQDDAGVVTLSIDDSHDGVCTADAGRDTFVVQGLPEAPTRLLVEQDGQDDIDLDLRQLGKS